MVGLPIDLVTYQTCSIPCSVWSVSSILSVLLLLALSFISGLSLLGFPGLVDIDPVYCMPADRIEAKGLHKNWEALPRRSD